jgi:hypothetical protein
VSYLIYEGKPEIDTWPKVLCAVPIAIPLVAGIIWIPDSAREGLAIFGVALFVGMLYRLLLPHRFQILSDKLRIELGRLSLPVFLLLILQMRDYVLVQQPFSFEVSDSPHPLNPQWRQCAANA